MIARAFVIVLFSTALLHGQVSAGPRENCLDCGGKGEVPCSRCGGSKKAEVPCPVCKGMGGKRCTLCDKDGQLTCERCNGRGYYVTYRAGIGGGPEHKPCPPRVPCPKCGGTTQQPCKKCNRACVITDKCPVCLGKGTEKCLRCEGKGKLGDTQPILVPELDTVAPANDLIKSRIARLKTALASLDLSTERVEGLKARLEELTVLFAAVKTRALALGDGSKVSANFLSDADTIKSKWKLCEASREDCESLLNKLVTLRTAAEDASPKLRDRIRSLDGARPGEPGQGEAIRPIEEQADRYTAAVDEADEALRRLARRLQTCEKEVAALDSKLSEQEDKEQRKRKQNEAQSAVFQNLQELLPTIAKRAGLPGLEGKLLSSKSALDLEVELSYFDDDAAEAAGTGEPEPSEALLEKIPSVVSRVFDSTPEVVTVRVHVDATCLTETGLEQRRAMQSFIMSRVRWSELTRGHFKNEWRTLLTKSKPSPMYPRGANLASDGTWVIVVLIGFCFLGLAVVFIARSRMMR